MKEISEMVKDQSTAYDARSGNDFFNSYDSAGRDSRGRSPTNAAQTGPNSRNIKYEISFKKFMDQLSWRPFEDFCPGVTE